MIKYILSHPIQYQSPLLKYLSKRINIKVIYRSDISLKKHFQPEFNKNVLIDKNLLNGYSYEFLKSIGTNRVTKIFPINIEFKNKIFTKDTKYIWVHGIKNWYNLLIIILGKFYNKKIFVRDEINLLKKRSKFNLIINRIFFKFIDYFIDAYLCIGKRNKEFYLYNKIKKEKLFLIPYVVDNQNFQLKQKKKNINKIQIFFIGKLIHRKGCDILLKAIKKCNELHNFKKKVELKIIGDGKLYPEYIKFKTKNNLTNVFFLGFKNQSQIKNYLQKSNILILPSREENWGLVINEAMNSENAIIASEKVGCSADIIKKNLNGFIFKNENYIDLSNKILKLTNNKKKINSFCKNSLKIINTWNFNKCEIGLKKAINYVSRK